MKKIALEQLEEIARALTKKALNDYKVPEAMHSNLVLTTLFEGDDRVFVLYVPAEKRSEGMVIARTRVNSLTGAASVEISGLDHK